LARPDQRQRDGQGGRHGLLRGPLGGPLQEAGRGVPGGHQRADVRGWHRGRVLRPDAEGRRRGLAFPEFVSRKVAMRHGKYPFIIGFLAVPVALYVTFVVAAYLQTFQLAFTDWSGLGPITYVGFDNFVTMWPDELFWRSVRHNLFTP